MLINPPSLADQAANLRTALLAEDAPFWLPDALHALIMAALARIFARLEDMIRLWQSGALPPPPASRAPSRHSARASRVPRRGRIRARRRHTSRDQLSPVAEQARPHATITADPACCPRRVATTPARLARAPPCGASPAQACRTPASGAANPRRLSYDNVLISANAKPPAASSAPAA